MRSLRPGAILLEVLVALAILGGFGVALIAQLQQSLRVGDVTRQAERRFVEANAFLEAVALWSPGDLDRHLGNRANGPWRLVVDHVAADLYDVSVRDSTDRATILETTLYRRRDAQNR